MIGIREVMEVVEEYLGNDDLNCFIAKFSALSHNIHRKGDPSAIALCGNVESLLAALYSGGQSPKFLREQLQNLSNEPVVYISHRSFEPVSETYAPTARVEELAYS
jgi:hypothetical protein